MHVDVLGSDEYPTFAFRPARLQGAFSRHGRSEFLLVGTIAIRGVDHPLTMPVTAGIDQDHITARTAFTIPYVEWGMEDPSNWLLRVAKEVLVTVEVAGRLTAKD